jgi:hypothetical protein
LAAAAAGDLKGMPNLFDLLTKPLQIGLQIASGAIKLIQGGDEPPPRPEPSPEAPQTQQRPPQPKSLDDATITDKVETILFRDDSVAKGKIDVNTVDGVVYLRGVAKTPAQIKALEAKALEIPEVKQVENLLHLPKTPAQKKTRRSTGTAAARKRAPKRTTSERKTPATPKAEPTPKALAAAGEGRKPAPLGSSDNGGSGSAG